MTGNAGGITGAGGATVNGAGIVGIGAKVGAGTAIGGILGSAGGQGVAANNNTTSEQFNKPGFNFNVQGTNGRYITAY